MNSQMTRLESGEVLPSRPFSGGIVRRKCACGNHTSGRECDECRNKKNSVWRKSLATQPKTPNQDRVPSIVHDVLRSGGHPLDLSARASFETSFGRDFSQVKVHSDAKAAASAEAVNAQAYTFGREIVFGAGRYAPQTLEGRKLLAHELAHVNPLQENAPSSAPLAIGCAECHEEAEARSAETLVNASGPSAGEQRLSASRLLHRKEKSSSGDQSSQPKTASPSPARSTACIQPVKGEEIESLLESRAVTIIEYGAEWCGPCKMLQADLKDICARFSKTPPPVTVRFYSLDVDDPLNEEAGRRDAPGSVPYLSIYVGTTRRYHESGRPEREILEQLINEQIEYASHSGAARGALTGLKWGLGIGGGAGLALGIGLAFAGVLTGGLGLLAVLGLAVAGAAVGAGLGAGIGALIGALTDKRERAAGTRVGFNEAETLIRRRYGRHLPGTAGPLHNAHIRPVTQAELQMWNRCRHPENEKADLSNRVGWIDTGPEPPAKIASPDDEPDCANSQKLEHATVDRPVIYYARDRRDLTVLIHEGLHAHAHPKFGSQLRDFVNEGATEYLTEQLAREIGVPSTSDYTRDRVPRVKDLVSTVGEEALQLAFFKGDFNAANRLLGPCGLQRWAQLLQMSSDEAAKEVLRSRNVDYCPQISVFPAGGSGEKQAVSKSK